ncbi:MAG: hypothetical protein CO029_00785 [Candidatus Magasanikbacteria bacterium CG_4_9_14_0_2_um_filter_41_10]|uniref:Helix-turn-helix domain-containing protein n=1 Tax=Candidatus Magasanikbacteria bacterium CG_4_10_14_0_2_um_filter_41_31 TaxID=1974639 RepID=A0A2M7V246_9BACT|nr:MAG: hypothetical protein AUJ37_01260 [Candidatus Magasanikbacteria bacterium CG1_02_41_34]PIZ92462.1 MAG: hypothetical protein COX83_04235 [Candidatus Magasanikbacteria bacterium CG_4_10_14_0_2_um_filter_41_31]PJC53839.1 MAG: hypothetical protein CO029_00785 [Candidatus Magasanikbacteria bacterium CG_4_9_14_0_2_um_filter_41_10]
MGEIKPNEVYTTAEVETLLKVSKSTVKRLIKKGLIRTNKIGGQYRILGHELLRMLSPDVDKKATNAYKSIKEKTKKRVKNW